MDRELRNRRLIFVGTVVLVVAYAGYRDFGTRKSDHHGWSWHDDHSSPAAPKSDETPSPAAGNNAAQLTLNNTDGSVGIKIPGFSADVHMPGLNLDKGNFDIDGVKLYPGSKIEQMSVNGSANNDPDEESKGAVALSFDAPAAPATVRDYYVKALTAHGFAIDPAFTPTKLVAHKSEGDKHVEISLMPRASNTTHGALAVSGH